MSDYNLETKCIHSGYTPSKGEPCALPVYQSTTYKYDTTDEMGQLFDLKADGYFYTRLQNPTNDAVAAKIADLEGGVAAILTSSGQAANFYAVFNICEAGDHVVAASTIYGGTFNLLAVTFKKLGIDCTFVDTDATEEEIAAAFKPNTKVLFAETIANPALVVLDIEKFAHVGQKLLRTAGNIVYGVAHKNRLKFLKQFVFYLLHKVIYVFVMQIKRTAVYIYKLRKLPYRYFFYAFLSHKLGETLL